ncbi:AAA domain-containing protein, partial [Bacteroidota bacterium]
FTNSGLNENLVIGNIVNTCFDELLNNNDVDFDEVFNRAILIRPLQIFVLALRDKSIVKVIRDRTQNQFNNLKKIIQDINVEILSIEPSFISPKYGLQGRLDVLLEYFDDPAKKDIIELKSGKSPSTPITIKSSEGKKITTYVWNNHLAQTTCYNLLLDSTFEGRSGDSRILYSSSIVDPLRDAVNILQKKQEVLNLRNWIIAYENAIREGNYNLFKEFTADKFGSLPPFSKKDLIEFQESYTAADEISKEYFNRYVTFILNEICSSKLGSNKGLNKGFSSLWLESIPEKEESFKILTNLKLDKKRSDFSNYHLVFYCDEANLKLTSLRKGDMIVLYPIEDDGSASVLNNQVLKCAIKELSEEFIKVSLRNKLYDKRMFTEDRLWAIEQDYLDSTNKKLLNSVFEFLKTTDRKRGLILGKIEPEFEIQKNISNEELNNNQKEIVEKALSAKDYYLIQGPPGTGKTSYVLRNIVDNIYSTTDENILVLAYTNRAVDEICSALKNINSDLEFLRTGSKESSEHSDVLISVLSENISTRELFIKVRNARIFVSTVSSIISNTEILELKEFHTAVIDEASQILEPQIVGILSKVSRFILIGDEKQLPAVVIQDDIKSTTISEILERIHLKDLRTSLFERLLTCCNENGWNQSFGMLKKQARMHVEIQEFPNKYFYDNLLEPFQPGNWQSKSCKRFLLNSPDAILRELAKSRVIFIPTKSEKAFKVNFNEAKLTVNLAKKIREVYHDDFNENTLGIISPFRAQCAEIYRQMESGLRKKVMVDTVERFQGSERDIIIISFAVNHEYQLASIQSLTSYVNITVDRKLNVAITRAKEHLIFLGNPEILRKSQVYLKLIDFIKEKGGFSDLSIG